VIRVETNSGLDKLFFELASESRLSILRVLQKENLKMQEIARRLDVTATEAFRQLERLSAALLVQRQPDGTFALAQYGKLMLQLTASLDFASKHREYFSTHDLTRLPAQFVSRIDELAQIGLVTDTIENLNRGEQAYREAEQYGWGIAEGTIPQHMNQIMDQQIAKGLKLRFLIPESRLAPEANPPVTVKNVEIRTLPDIPALVVVTEKEAGIWLKQVGGKMDYAGFFGKDHTFHGWARDLFLYYWDHAKRL
jgi:predicted transcriptional regulator